MFYRNFLDLVIKMGPTKKTEILKSMLIRSESFLFGLYSPTGTKLNCQCYVSNDLFIISFIMHSAAQQSWQQAECVSFFFKGTCLNFADTKWRSFCGSVVTSVSHRPWQLANCIWAWQKRSNNFTLNWRIHSWKTKSKRT